jgi:hypothetical protein
MAMFGDSILICAFRLFAAGVFENKTYQEQSRVDAIIANLL